MYEFDSEYDKGWPYLVEILELSTLLGDLSKVPSINDTMPGEPEQHSPFGTFIKRAWPERPPNDGWHWEGIALDQGGFFETELARFWMSNRGRGVVELIHFDGDRGYLISNGSVGHWDPTWKHKDHVHTAMHKQQAKRWRDELALRWSVQNEVVGGVFLS